MRLFVAIVLLCLVQISQAQSPRSDAPDETERSEIPQQQDNQGSIPPAIVVAFLESIETTVDYLSRNQAQTSYPSEYDRASVGLQRRDLDTQRDIAFYTHIMAWAAGLSFVVALTGLWMLGRTLIYTRDAAINTKKANTILENSSQKQIRSYISVRNASPVGKRPTGSIGWDYEVTYKNDGLTPAKKVCLYFRDYSSTAELVDGELPEIDVDTLFPYYFGTLAPGAEKTENCSGMVHIPFVSHWVYIYGKVIYQDVFGNWQETPFCGAISPGHSAGPERTRFGNDST